MKFKVKSIVRRSRFVRLGRSFVRNNCFLCSVYLRFKKTSLTLPNSKTDYHVAAFPRCANTFTRYLGKRAFPSLLLSTHIHTIATIKRALQCRVFTVAIIRDPLSCIASLCIKSNVEETDLREIDLFIKDYVEYHKFILKNIDSIKILEFRDLIEDPCIFINIIKSKFDLNHNISMADVGNIVLEFKEKDKMRDPYQSSMPTALRSRRKLEYEKIILGNKSFLMADGIFKELVSRKVKFDCC